MRKALLHNYFVENCFYLQFFFQMIIFNTKFVYFVEDMTTTSRIHMCTAVGDWQLLKHVFRTLYIRGGQSTARGPNSVR